MLRRWVEPGLEYVSPLPFLVQSKLNSVATAHCNVRCFQSLAARGCSRDDSRLFGSSSLTKCT
jgi:hypothetical protein